MTEVEIGTGLEKDHFLETLVTKETLGVQTIGSLDQDQGQVQKETESGVTNVGNIITLQKTVLHPGKKRNWSNSNRCLT